MQDMAASTEMKSHESSDDIAVKDDIKTLSDILVDHNLEVAKTKEKGHLIQSTLKAFPVEMPDLIVGDWLYLGKVMQAASMHVVKELGITHILNCTEEHLCYHIENESVKYARIALADVTGSNLYDYMEAAGQFIDECNGDNKNKILVHCAAGVSRSASIVISYLMHRTIEWTEMEMKCIDIIRETLGYPQKTTYETLTLSEAYGFVKSWRSIICPNDGFIEQLERSEMVHHDGKSTKSDVIRTNGQSAEMYEKIRALRKGDESNRVQRGRKCVIL